MLFFFTPLIAAMAGNVGVQSSAIIVQGLANDNIKGSLWNRLMKEIGLSLVNGLILALLVVAYGAFQGFDLTVNYAIASSLIIVIIIAALIGTFVPIILDKKGIDPALATGPFYHHEQRYFWNSDLLLDCQNDVGILNSFKVSTFPKKTTIQRLQSQKCSMNAWCQIVGFQYSDPKRKQRLVELL